MICWDIRALIIKQTNQCVVCSMQHNWRLVLQILLIRVLLMPTELVILPECRMNLPRVFNWSSCCYIVTFLCNVLLLIVCPFVFWLLYYVFLFNFRRVTTSMVFSNFSSKHWYKKGQIFFFNSTFVHTCKNTLKFAKFKHEFAYVAIAQNPQPFNPKSSFIFENIV